MAEEINLNKEVFNKRAYLKTIDTSFKELGVPTIQEQITAQPSVQEFFDLYNTLFYNINEFGPTNSHEFLIKTSQEYIGFEEENEIIELLQAEIATLRTELLNAQKQLADFASSIQSSIPEATIPEVEVPKIEDITPPPPPEVEVPQSPSPPEPPSNKQRVIKDFKKFSKSSIRRRAKRLNLNKGYIRKIKKKENL
tara:strand:+ start:67 stop:654 length:588 start_codon:yes stop_codon:yes gene_type:complete